MGGPFWGPGRESMCSSTAGQGIEGRWSCICSESKSIGFTSQSLLSGDWPDVGRRALGPAHDAKLILIQSGWRKKMTRYWVLLGLLWTPLAAQPPDTAFFESKIRPVLATKCYACHSSTLKSPMGGFVLDTSAGLRKGGSAGPVLVPGKPAESQLLQALRYTDPHLQMPPSGKLADPVIADFERWIAAGAPDPRADSAPGTQTPAPLKGMSIDAGRNWWAFQPVRELPTPKLKNPA